MKAMILVLSLVIISDLAAQLSVTYESKEPGTVFPAVDRFDDLESCKDYLEGLQEDSWEKGYLLFSFDLLSVEDSMANVELFKGPKYTIDDSDRRLLRDLRSEMDRLENSGYPFVELLVKSSLDSLKLYTSATIAPGPEITIDSLLFVDGEMLPQSLLAKHIGIEKGDLYSESRMRLVDRKLKGLPFIKVVRPSAVVFSGAEARPVIYAEKRDANRIDGILGFQPDANGRLQFTGDVKLSLQNALSHLDAISLNWQRVADNSQNLDLAMRIPYLFKTSLGVEASISQYRQDSTFNEVGIETGLFSVLEKGGSLKLFFASRVVNDLLQGDEVEKQGTSAIQYGMSYQIDLRNDPFNPRSGIYSELRFSYGDKDLNTSTGLMNESRTIGQWSADADIQKYFRLWSRSSLKTRVNARHIDSEVVIQNEFHRIGGLSTLRGHDEQSIRGSSFLIGTMEYRFLTGERSHLSAFSDYGYVAALTEGMGAEDRFYGFGIGALIDTGAGQLSLSYALGSQNSDPVILSTGKVHFGYAAVF